MIVAESQIVANCIMVQEPKYVPEYSQDFKIIPFSDLVDSTFEDARKYLLSLGYTRWKAISVGMPAEQYRKVSGNIRITVTIEA